MKDISTASVVDALELALTAIRAGSKKERSEQKWWTHNIKQFVAQRGQELDFYVSAGGIEANNKEWLYDVTWSDYGKNGITTDPAKRRLQGIALALESEFGNIGDVIDDFEKLIQSRAQIKTMVFSADCGSGFDKTCETFKEIISCFPGSDSGSYVFAGFPNDADNKLEVRKIGF